MGGRDYGTTFRRILCPLAVSYSMVRVREKIGDSIIITVFSLKWNNR